MLIFLFLVSLFTAIILTVGIFGLACEVLSNKAVIDKHVLVGLLFIMFFDVFFILNAVYLYQTQP